MTFFKKLRFFKNKALLKASEYNDFEQVKLLLESGAYESTKTSNNETPLLFASKNNNFDMIKLLLDNDANIFVKEKSDKDNYDGQDETPYLDPYKYAIKNNNLEILKSLLENSRDSISDTIDKYNLLGYASKYGRLSIVKFLLNEGAYPDGDIYEWDICKPLENACYNNHKNVVKILLEHGADPFTVNSYMYKDCLSASIDKDVDLEIVDMLIPFMFKEIKFKHKFSDYENISKLIILTTRIEEILEEKGANGKGMWEKAKSLENNLPNKIIDEIFEIAELRNNAVHGNPIINNVDSVIEKCTSIIRKLGKKFKLKHLNKSSRYLKELIMVNLLTYEIEQLIEKKGANGFSLTDKVKSFETVEYPENDESYEYKEYKRNLLGGHYNTLRGIAYERNMIMHQHRYSLEDTNEFIENCKEIIESFSSKKIKNKKESDYLDYDSDYSYARSSIDEDDIERYAAIVSLLFALGFLVAIYNSDKGLSFFSFLIAFLIFQVLKIGFMFIYVLFYFIKEHWKMILGILGILYILKTVFLS